MTTTPASAAEIAELCGQLIAKARERKMMLYTRYQDLWFTPDQLEAEQRNGKFCWGPVNWQLRPVTEFLDEARHHLQGAERELERRERLGEAMRPNPAS